MEAKPGSGRLAIPYRIAAAVVLAWLATAVLSAAAQADADPASDILLGENVFYPYNPPVSAPIQARLNAVVAAAHRAGLPLKVALIATPVDLGAIPTFFGKPAQYAAFLDQEISFGTKPPLLVVMPNGFGVAGLSGAAAASVRGLAKPAVSNSNALALAAIGAGPKIAAASGHPLAGVSTPGRPGGGSGVVLPVVILVVVCVGLAAGILAWRHLSTRPRTASRTPRR